MIDRSALVAGVASIFGSLVPVAPFVVPACGAALDKVR
jgi:VIT1/CCC1 family predicted Fe2+/Mn2+ transporter